MTRGICRRSAKRYVIPSFALGLITDRDYLVADVRGAQLLQNARTRQGRVVKRNGTRNYSPTLGTGLKARLAGLHQWYPATPSDDNLVYGVSNGTIYRMPWDSTSVDPPTSSQAMAFDDGVLFGITDFAHFVDFNDYCFACNGTSNTAQMRRDSVNSMYHFQLAEPSAPTVTTAAGGGSIAAGVYGYAIRYVREREERVREYWSGISAVTNVTCAGGSSTNTITLPVPTDGQLTETGKGWIYIYRTGTDLETLYYLTRVAVGTTSYVDTAADATTEIDEDCLDRIANIANMTVDDGCLFVVARDTTTGSWFWYNSVDSKPQEFGIYNNGEISEGSGDVTGCEAFGGAVYVFRERGIIIYRKNSAGTYDREAYWPGWGCIAPWSCRALRSGNKNFVTFFDDAEGMCLVTGNGVESLKRRKYSDIVKYIDPGYIDPNYRKYVSVGVKNDYLYLGVTPIGAIYNTRIFVYDFAHDCWFGPDLGYPLGPTFSRINAHGVLGQGELIAGYDGDTVRVMEVDANYSRDFTSTGTITLQVDSMAIAADWLPREVEFQELALYAKLGNVFRMNVKVPAADPAYSQAYYIAPSGRYFMDDGSVFDGTATFDESVEALFDTAVFDRATDVFDSMKDKRYIIELDSCAAQGPFLTLSLYDELSYPFEIGTLEILAVDRGE